METDSSLMEIKMIEFSGLNPTRNGIAASKSCGEVKVVMRQASANKECGGPTIEILLISRSCGVSE
jgi:hypothetical protein